MTFCTFAAAAALSFFALGAPAAFAQYACPAPHADYRRPVPVWAGFGYQVNACPGDKVDIAATLIVSPTAPEGVIQIPQTLPWHVDLSGLSKDEVDYLRQNCQADLPCVSHFQITVDRVVYPKVTLGPGEFREGDFACHYPSIKTDGVPPANGYPPGYKICRSGGSGETLATLDGWD